MGVSTPLESKKAITITMRNKPKDFNAFFIFALSFEIPLNEKTNVTVIAINKIIWLRIIIGVIDPKFPDAAAIFIESSPLIKTIDKKTKPRTPREMHPILVIFSRFIIYYFFWAERISIKVIDASSMSLTIESILATI